MKLSDYFGGAMSPKEEEEGEERCNSPKSVSNYTLFCRLPRHHDTGEDPTWHQSVIEDDRRIVTDTMRTTVHSEETIEWSFDELRKRLEGSLGSLKEEKVSD